MNKGKTAVRKARLIPASEVFATWRKGPGYRQAYDSLDEEFSIMAALIKARADAGITQAEVARRMQSTQPAVARLEAGGHRASLKSIRAYAEATGHRVRLIIEPAKAKR
jgi:DNA-binding XRE family transcriptional regulator